MPRLPHTMQLATCIAALALTCACTANALPEANPLPEADKIFLNKHLPGVVLGQGEDDATAGDWLPLRPQSQRFDMPGRDNAQFTLSTMPTVRSMGQPVGSTKGGWMFSASGSFFATLRQDANGSIVEPTMVSHDLGLLIRLNPPEPLLLTDAKEGKAVSRNVRVRIYDMHEPAVLAHSGDRHLTYTDMGIWRINVPAGTFNAKLVRVRAANDIAGETFQSVRYMFFARDVGVVAMVDTKPVTHAIYPMNGAHAAVLVSTGPLTR